MRFFVTLFMSFFIFSCRNIKELNSSDCVFEKYVDTVEIDYIKDKMYPLFYLQDYDTKEGFVDMRDRDTANLKVYVKNIPDSLYSLSSVGENIFVHKLDTIYQVIAKITTGAKVFNKYEGGININLDTAKATIYFKHKHLNKSTNDTLINISKCNGLISTYVFRIYPLK